MLTPPPRRLDRVLGACLLLAVCLWVVRAHWETIDDPKQAQKITLHEAVLVNEAPDPYQYKLWLITLVFDRAQAWSGVDIGYVFFANTLFSALFLFLAHHLWLRSLVSGPAALVGGLLLGALGNILLLTGWHHPYEFWGVGLFCLLLRAVHRDVDWKWLAVICLVTGLVWEKQALVAVLWGMRALLKGRPFLPSLWRGLVLLAASLAIPLGLRLFLGTGRAHVDGDTWFHVQEWSKVAWFQLPYFLPFVLIFLTRFRTLPTWVRLLWLYVPVLVAAYVSQHYILHEVRSFWALVPVFSATLACWFESCLPSYSVGPQSCQAAQ